MSLERLVEEVRRRSESDLEAERSRFAESARQILAQREAAVRAVAQESDRAIAQETARLRAAETARAKGEARKLLFEARQRSAQRSLDDARRRLTEHTSEEEYAALLKRLYDFALGRLGKPIRVAGRAEDAAVLRSIAGRGFASDPVPITGGLIAESGDGDRRLDLSFEELLRRREDDLLALARSTGKDG